MTNELIIFAIGVSLLLISTNAFVEFSKKISLALKISPLVIGMTVVSIGTSLPEFAVSALASIRNDPGLALGNIVGSNVVNVLLVFPVGILIGKLRVGSTKTQRSALLMLAATTLFLYLKFTGYPMIFSGTVLLMVAFFITVFEYSWGIQGRLHEDIRQFSKSRSYSMHPAIVFIVLLSVFGIIAGGVLTVQSVEAIAKLSGISTTVLGLSLTAIATSLPELLTTIFSQERDMEKITIGNLLGSQIYNLLLVGGVIFFFSERISLPVIDWFFLVFSSISFSAIIFVYSGKVLPKILGVILLSMFLLYLVLLGF